MSLLLLNAAVARFIRAHRLGPILAGAEVSARGFDRFIPSPAHPECERSERIEGAIWTKRHKPHRPLDTLAALALGVSGVGKSRPHPLAGLLLGMVGAAAKGEAWLSAS